MTLGAARFMLFGGRVARSVALTTAAIVMAAPDPGMQQGTRVVLSDAALIRALNSDPVLPSSAIGLGSALIAMTAPDPAIGYTSLALDSATAVATAPNPTAQSSGSAWANGYARRRTLIVPPASISGGVDLNSFPMLLKETRQSFRSTANGGSLLATGYDMRLESASAFKLGHEREVWNAATGETSLWINVPTLSASANTRQDIYYGKADQATDEASAAAVWSGYALVANCLTGADRTGQSRTLTVSGVSSEAPAETGNWWDFTGMRSARANGRRSGISYWGASSSTFTTNLDRYERQVAWCDAWNGGQPDAADETMDKITGGPNTTDNDTITAGSALDWSGSSSHWRAGWNILPGGTIAIWAANFISRDRRTDGGDGSIWTDIKNGDFDRHFTNMGRRIRKNFDTPSLNPRGHLPSRLLIRMNHENNQSNYYRVLAAQKTNYCDAMNRAIDKIRVGLGTTYANQVKFMHAPAHGSEGINLGTYASWCPSNVDIVSVSWHPRAAQNSAAKLTEYNNGEDDPLAYGLSELLAYSNSTGKPMCFPEWSPRYESGTGVACPVADLAMDSFDAWLTANASRIICDCVYHQNTLNTTAYQPADTAGQEAWARSVNVYKTKWSGEKKT